MKWLFNEKYRNKIKMKLILTFTLIVNFISGLGVIHESESRKGLSYIDKKKVKIGSPIGDNNFY